MKHATENSATGICLIGDSHLVAIRRAIIKGHEIPNRKMTLFAAPRDGMANLIQEGDLFRPSTPELSEQIGRTSGGLTHIRPADFDYVVLCGLGLRVQGLLSVFNHFEFYFGSGQEMDPKKSLLSLSALRAMIDDYLEKSLSISLAKAVRRTSTAPVLIIPQPLPVIDFVETYAHRWPWLKSTTGHQTWTTLSTELNSRMRERFTSEGFAFLEQPRQTLGEDGFTKVNYHQVTKRGDWAHMNAAYGRALINQIADFLRSKDPRATQASP